MLAIQNITLYAGSLCLLQDASFTLHPGQKVGLIGQNGAGKSTLFKAILGQINLDGGDIKMPPNWQVGYVEQEVAASDLTAMAYVLQGDTLYSELQKQLQQAEQAENHEQLVQLYDQLDLIQGYKVPMKAKQLLFGLGFKAHEFDQPLHHFSGGWQVRLKLARALMQRADLLLLDEPTNHLDIEAVSWLANWLSHYEGALMVISHDRYFLDQVVEGIVLLAERKLHYYAGNFAAYERQRHAQLMQQQALHDKQKQQMQHLQTFISRFKAKASKAKQAQSRVKALERMEMVAAVQATNPFHFTFASPEHLPDPMIQVEQVSFRYPEQTAPILHDVEIVLRAGDRIGLVGVNGSGKSTFLKVLIGELKPQAGKVIISSGVKVGYFAQHQLEALTPEQNPLQHLLKLNTEMSDQQARDFLGQFGFKGEKALDPVKQFSGGEKARLSLAMIVSQKPNLIILDEPTNHLDMETRDALEMALLEFRGAIIVVSHDRHLLTSIVDQFWWVHDKQVVPFIGGLESYLQAQLEVVKAQSAQLKAEQKSDDKPQENAKIPSPAGNKKQQRQQKAQLRKTVQAAIKPLKQQSQKIEQQLAKAQQQLTAIHQQMQQADFYEQTDSETLTSILKQQAELEAEMEDLEMQWLELEAEMESVEAKIYERYEENEE
ncbi:ABC-F family ATP-binding cassette domain-containing protein [Galenea microaerophila]